MLQLLHQKRGEGTVLSFQLSDALLQSADLLAKTLGKKCKIIKIEVSTKKNKYFLKLYSNTFTAEIYRHANQDLKSSINK